MLKMGFIHEYMKSWYTINETKLPLKYVFYRNLNKKNISCDDYKHT